MPSKQGGYGDALTLAQSTVGESQRSIICARNPATWQIPKAPQAPRKAPNPQPSTLKPHPKTQDPKPCKEHHVRTKSNNSTAMFALYSPRCGREGGASCPSAGSSRWPLARRALCRCRAPLAQSWQTSPGGQMPLLLPALLFLPSPGPVCCRSWIETDHTTCRHERKDGVIHQQSSACCRISIVHLRDVTSIRLPTTTRYGERGSNFC
jgi:hypothetical protein